MMKKIGVILAMLVIGFGAFAAEATNDVDLEFLAKSFLSEKKMVEVMEAQLKRVPIEITSQFKAGFQEEFMKEVKARYPEMVKELKAGIKETYTPEQIMVLVEFHKKNPWAGDKNYELMDKVSQAFAKMGGDIGQKILDAGNANAPKK
jgi:hypothetical protein